MLKHLPKDTLKKLGKTLIYSKQGAYYNETTIGRRIHDGSGFTATGLTVSQIATYKKNNVKDLNIDERISKIKINQKTNTSIEFH